MTPREQVKEKKKKKEQNISLDMILRNSEVTILKISPVKYYQNIDKIMYSILPLFSL